MPLAPRDAEFLDPVTELHWRAVRDYQTHVVVQDGCWGWSGTTAAGYPHIQALVGGKNRSVRAHRLSFVLHNGPLPDDANVLHSCDTPLCTNPTHLRAGTHAENMRDKIRRGRASIKTSACDRDEAVRRVRSGEPVAHVAAWLGVHQSTVRDYMSARDAS